MTYEDVQDFMNRRWKSTMHLGLSRVKAVLHELGNPHKNQDYIHVAGTNGKGSTVSAIAGILAMSGKKVGVYTSPYLERFTDRMRILSGPETMYARLSDSSAGEISESMVAALFTEILAACDRIVAAGGEEASEFEVLTAAALLYFSRQNCDVVVLETGLGGRLDATNVIDFAKVTVITALAYDHCAVLGNTMREIAGEKAAIIKEGTEQVFLYDPSYASSNEEDAKTIFQVIGERCRACSAPLTVVNRSEISAQSIADGGQYFTLAGFDKPFFTPLLGDFQLLNAAMAIHTALAYDPSLRRSDALYNGIRLMRWPGRLEYFDVNPPILLDGAHNPQAALALVQSMAKLQPDKSLVLLLGVLEDKDYPAIIDALYSGLTSRLDAIVCTQPGVQRDLSAERLGAFCQNLWTSQKDIAIIEQPSIEDALKQAQALAVRNNALVLACGSLFLVSNVRHEIVKQTEALAGRRNEED